MLSTLHRDYSELNEYVRVYQYDLPCSFRGFTKPFPDGYYAIILNSRLSWEQNVKTLQHEYDHILNNDFDSDYPVGQIEIQRHEKI